VGVLRVEEDRGTNGVWFDWFNTKRRVGIYYFYILDPEFGAGFIKVCTYFPYAAQVWLTGHEWVKGQADAAKIRCRSLANEFAACDDPGALQAICDRSGPALSITGCDGTARVSN
jgi:hypothetical protein